MRRPGERKHPGLLAVSFEGCERIVCPRGVSSLLTQWSGTMVYGEEEMLDLCPTKRKGPGSMMESSPSLATPPDAPPNYATDSSTKY